MEEKGLLVCLFGEVLCGRHGCGVLEGGVIRIGFGRNLYDTELRD